MCCVFLRSRILLNYSYDRCNHLRQHRQSLQDATKKFPQPVRLLSLNWSLDQPRATVHCICGDRVQQRGDNHQSLRLNLLNKSQEEVIWMFINRTEELTLKEVDNVVEMELGESLEDSVNIHTCRIPPLTMGKGFDGCGEDTRATHYGIIFDWYKYIYFNAFFHTFIYQKSKHIASY